jgi:biopolymer transport protein ExbD
MRIPEESTKAPEINIVPLIDIIFTIMVVFIVASLQLTRSQGLNVNLPNASEARQRLQPDVTVSVTQEGKIAVNRAEVSLSGLTAAVEKALSDKGTASDAERLVVINADLALTHGKVVDVMNALQQIPDISLAIAARRTAATQP